MLKHHGSAALMDGDIRQGVSALHGTELWKLAQEIGREAGIRPRVRGVEGDSPSAPDGEGLLSAGLDSSNDGLAAIELCVELRVGAPAAEGALPGHALVCGVETHGLHAGLRMSKAEADLVVPCGLGNSAFRASGGDRAESLVGTAEDSQDLQGLDMDA